MRYLLVGILTSLYMAGAIALIVLLAYLVTLIPYILLSVFLMTLVIMGGVMILTVGTACFLATISEWII